MAVRRWISLLIAVALVLCIPAFTQNQPEGRITGVVHDASGAVVAGANITITNEGTNVEFTVTSGPDGGFVVPTVSVGSYKITISAKGFSTAVYTNVLVEPAKTYSLTASLKVGGTAETVEVVAGQDLVNTTTSEVSNTITVTQVQNLPLLGRDIIGLVGTQAGVAYNQRAATSINGQRPSWSQVTLDGMSIQDLFIRTNAVDYIPNRPTTDTVDSVTVVTGAQGSDASMGSSGVRMVTPSGTNAFHGSAWDYNRNSKFAGNPWFNNYNGIDRPFRNRNEYGGKLGGPIIKNKLFFYGFFVGIKDRRSSTRSVNLPQNDDMLQGWFRYVPSGGGAVQRVNVLTGAGLVTTTTQSGCNPCALQSMNIDPKIQQFILGQIFPAADINNPIAPGNVRTGTMSFSQRNNYDRTNPGGKIDFELSAKHHLDATFSYMHEVTDRGEYSTYYTIPKVYNDSHPKLFSAGWRYTISNTLVNTFRGGFNLTDAPFDVNYNAPDGWFVANSPTSSALAGALTNPMVTLRFQGRQSNSYQWNDNASWVHGKHNVVFGGSYQAYRVHSYNEAGTLPTYYTGMQGAPKTAQLFRTSTSGGPANGNFPTAISSSDLTAANSLRAFLGGIISNYAQTFNVTSRTSGYVDGARSDRRLPLNDLSFFLQDQWRMRPNLTLTLGAKWEYLSPYVESNGLAVGAMYSNPLAPQTSLLTMGPMDQVGFMDRSWKKQYKNIGPSVGFAWDPFKDGKTSLRGGYSLTFVNDDIYRFAGNAADGNSGLSTGVGPSAYLFNTFSNPPTIAKPTFKMPLTITDLRNINPTNVIWALDPNAKVPMVHELYFGVQRELPGQMSVEVRYVGTLGRELLRGIDLNQSNAGTNTAYLADFARARSNYFLCGDATGNTTQVLKNGVSVLCGAQPLTFFPNLVGGMSAITGSTGQGYLARNEAAGLAANMLGAPLSYTNAFATFLPNPNIYALDYGTNAAFSSYHGLQTEVKRRFRNGLQFEGNYTFSKNLSNSPADSGQTRFDPFLDNARPWLAKARSNYDLRHQFKANFIYDLPFGRGKFVGNDMNKYLDKVIGGWQMSSIFVLQSGNPFSILAGRSTFNRRNGTQTAVSPLSVAELKKYLGVINCPSAGIAKCGTDYTGKVNTGIFYISPLITDPDTGLGVAPDSLNNLPASNFHQVLFNPGAGQIGNLGLMAFDSPGYWNVDLGLMKQFKVTERVNTKIRADFFNMPNHPQFWFGGTSGSGDTDPNTWDSQGRPWNGIFGTNSSARVIQFSLRVEF